MRARVARAWIDYIVDTKMPWGTRWVLGGGNRKRALTDVREAAQMESDFFTHTEAEFALWDMEVRERNMAYATDVARRLAHDFPDNRELRPSWKLAKQVSGNDVGLSVNGGTLPTDSLPGPAYLGDGIRPNRVV